MIKKQRYQCACCKGKLEQTANVDHITPLRAGGTNQEKNLHVLCPDCHARKTRLEPSKMRLIEKFPHASYRFCWRCGIIYSAYFRHWCDGTCWWAKKCFIK